MPDRPRKRLATWAATAGAWLAATIMAGIGSRLLIGWPASWLAACIVGSALLAGGSAVAIVARNAAGSVLRWALHAALLVTLSALVEILIVVGLGHRPVGGERGAVGRALVGAVVVAVIWLTTRGAVDDWIAVRRWGQRGRPVETLGALGDRLAQALPVGELLLQALDALRSGLALSAAEVWLAAGRVLERTAATPSRPRTTIELAPEAVPVITRAEVAGVAWLQLWAPGLATERRGAQIRAAPIAYHGHLLGMVVAERADSAVTFTPADEVVITEVARRIAQALDHATIDSALRDSLVLLERRADELRASRARVVAAADDARRRIERDLHDGAQQHLNALAAQIQLGRRLVTQEPHAVAGLLDELQAHVSGTIEEVRELARGIYPAVLASRGITEAVRSSAARSQLPVEVRADGVNGQRFDPDVEAAVYFCCAEAIQNANKHAGTSATITVTLTADGDRVRFAVADDGAGFDAGSVESHSGLPNLEDRAGALGGEVRITSAPGEGTSVEGWLPARER